MSMTINGRLVSAEVVLRETQKYLQCEGDKMGNITQVFRTAHLWDQKHKGGNYHWKMIDKEYEEYLYKTRELPDCVYHYYAEFVDKRRPARAKSA